MSVDVSTLQLRVESNEARTATGDLERLTAAGARSERSMARLVTQTAAFTAVLAAGVSIYRQASAAARTFEASISELSAITGATGDDLRFMSERAKEFGATTTLSASEAAKAFQLVASAKPDLLGNAEALSQVTRAAITLAEATGETLPAAANTLGSALNQFGADAEEAERYINVLAAGSQRGASEVGDVALALKNAGVVAAGAGLSFEQTNAAIQALAASGIKGGEAGTALRSVLLRLDTAADKELRPSVVGLDAALENLAAQGLDTADMVQLFGREGVTAASILVQNRTAVTDLTEALSGTSIAHEQARVRVDNLEGDLKQLNSAWESLLITVGERFTPAQRTATGEMTNIILALDEYISKAESAGSATDALLVPFRYLVATVFRAGVEFADLGDMVGAAMAQIDRYVRLDLEGARAVAEARRNTRRELEQDIATFEQRIFKGRELMELERAQREESDRAARMQEQVARAEERAAAEKIRRAQEQADADARREIAEIEAAERATRVLQERQAREAEALAIREEQERAADEQRLARQQAFNEQTLAQVHLRYADEAEAAGLRAQMEIEQLNALTDLTLEEEERRAELIEAIRQGLADRLVAIETKSASEAANARKEALTELEQFEAMSAKQRTQMVLGGMAEMTAGVAQHNKALFALNKVSAMANAAVSLPAAVMKTWERFGYPWGIPMVAAQTAAGLAQINAIRSASFSGGGGGTTPSMAGSVPTYNSMPAPDRGAELLAAGEQGSRLGDGREKVVHIEVSASGWLTPEAVDQAVAGIKQAIDDRDIVIFSPDSRQALELKG